MSKTINLIAAVDEVFGFGKDGKIPWHHPSDLNYFKAKTKGHTVIMGRKTFEDMETYFAGKPKFLPGRQCIVVTSGTVTEFENVTTAKSVTEAVEKAQALEGDVYFIGGEAIFKAGLNMADRVYLTFVPGNHGCDRFFPWEKLKKDYHLYNELEELSTGLKFRTYVHNIWGATNH